MQTGPILRRKRLGVIRALGGSQASPGCALLVAVTNGYGLFLDRQLTRLVTRLQRPGKPWTQKP